MLLRQAKDQALPTGGLWFCLVEWILSFCCCHQRDAGTFMLLQDWGHAAIVPSGKAQILRPDCNQERTFQKESPNLQGTNYLGNSKQGEEKSSWEASQTDFGGFSVWLSKPSPFWVQGPPSCYSGKQEPKWFFQIWGIASVSGHSSPWMPRHFISVIYTDSYFSLYVAYSTELCGLSCRIVNISIFSNSHKTWCISKGIIIPNAVNQLLSMKRLTSSVFWGGNKIFPVGPGIRPPQMQVLALILVNYTTPGKRRTFLVFPI